MTTAKKITHSWFPSLLCALFIAYASLYPYGDFGLVWNTEDWVKHGLAYFVLSILIAFPVKKRFPHLTFKNRIWIIILICTFYGILIELSQFFAPGRTPSLIDAGINLAGAGMAQAILFYIHSTD